MASTAPDLMRAVVREEYGGPDAVRVRPVPRLAPGRGQVRLRVVAGGVDRGQLHMLTGTPTLMRPFTGLRRPRRSGLGLEVAGVVDAVGPGVPDLAEGDAVFGVAPCALAETAVAAVRNLAPAPRTVGLVEAAALPVSGATALQALRDQARVRAGQRVLVVGASGGVGAYAVQIAVALGCEVVGVCSTAKVEHVRGLGAHEVLSYETDPFPADGAADVVLDIGGGRPVRGLRRALAPTGTLVLVGAENGGRVTGGLGRQVRASLASLGRRQRVRMFVSTTRTPDLQELARLVDDGAVRPVVDRVHPMAEAAAAFAQIAEGRVRGKVVVQVAD